MKHTFIPSNKEGIIVLIHGNSSSTAVFKGINSEFSILMPKLPGHEIDDNDKNNDFSFKHYKQELIALINTYKKPVLLVGNSLGGHLAIEIASNISDLRGLMIFGTPPVKSPVNFEEAFLPVAALQTFLTEHPKQEEIKIAATIAVNNKQHVSQIIEDFNHSNPKVRAATANDIMTGKWLNQYGLFVDLNCPKVIVAGDKDPSVNPIYLEEVVKQSKGHTRLIQIKDCGHYPTLEQPVEMNKIINDMALEVF